MLLSFVFFKSLFRDIWNRWLDSPGPFYLSKFLSEVKALNGVLSVFLAEMCETLHQNLTWLRNHSHLANAISAEFPHVSYFKGPPTESGYILSRQSQMRPCIPTIAHVKPPTSHNPFSPLVMQKIYFFTSPSPHKSAGETLTTGGQWL